MKSFKPLSAAILLAWSLSLIGCGSSSKGINATQDPTTGHSPAPASPAQNEPTATGTTSHNPRPDAGNRHAQTEESHFEARNTRLVQLSSLRLDPQTRAENARSARDQYAVEPLTDEEQARVNEIVRQTNDFRREHGLAPLAYDATLGAYAQVRARESITLYAHIRPDGTDFDSGSYDYGRWGENLYASPATADAAMAGWIKSETHRENLLREDYDRIGVGFIYDPDTRYKYYWSQVFASGQKKTRYHFANKPQTPRHPDMEHFLPSIINQASNGAIALKSGTSVKNNAQVALSKGTLNHSIYRNARLYSHNSFKAIIQDPAHSDFSYQTFGEIISPSGAPVQYVNIGQIMIPDDNTHFTATYKGASLGNLNHNSHVYAEVTAEVRFQQEKTMTIAFHNSKIAENDIHFGKVGQALSPAAHLNFRENLRWNASNGRFSGQGIHAQFYGPRGEEMGGQFERRTSGSTYSGAFGLKKQ